MHNAIVRRISIAVATCLWAFGLTSTVHATGTVITFEDPSAYSLTDFESSSSSVVTDAPNGFNGTHALKITHGDGTSSGVTIVKANSALISAGNTTITAMVYSPTAGRPVLMKVETKNDPTRSVEAFSTTSTVVGWNNLTFNFLNERNMTAAFNASYTYNMLSMLPGYGTTAHDVYYVDDITTSLEAISGGGGDPTASPTVITYESSDITGYLTAGFDGASATVTNAPAGGIGGKALQILRNGGQNWAGADIINVSTTNTRITDGTHKVITMNFYSPVHGTIKVKLKMLDAQVSKSVLAQYGWQQLSFDFGTSLDSDYGDVNPYSSSFIYTKFSLFPNFGVVDSAPGRAYYVDDIAFNGGVTPSLATKTQKIGALKTSVKRYRVITLPASTNHHLAITWTTSTPLVCAVNGRVVTGLAKGSCRVTGVGAGNSTYKTVTKSATIKVK